MFIYFIFRSLWKSNKGKNREIAAGWQLLAFSANAHLTIWNFEAQILTSCDEYTIGGAFLFRGTEATDVPVFNERWFAKTEKTFAEDFSGCLQIRGSFKKWNFIETKSCFTESETHFRRKKLLWCCYVRLNLLFSINGLRFINSFEQLSLQKAS